MRVLLITTFTLWILAFSNINAKSSNNTYDLNTLTGICDNFNKGIYKEDQIKLFANLYHDLPQNNRLDVANLTKCAVYLSDAYYSTQQYIAAEQLLEECLSFVERMEAWDDIYYPRIVQSLASYYSFRCDYNKGIDLLSSRLEYIPESDKALTRSLLTSLEIKRGNKDFSLIDLTKTISIFENLYANSPTKEIAEYLSALYSSRATLYENTDFEKKIESCEKALKLLEKHNLTKSDNYLYINNNLSVAYFYKGDYQKSLEYINKLQKLNFLDLDVLRNKLHIENLLHKKDLDQSSSQFLSLIKESEKQMPYLTEGEQFYLWSNLKSYYNDLLYVFVDNPQKTVDVYDFLLHVKGYLLNYSIEFRKKIYKTKNERVISVYEDFKDNGIAVTEKKLKDICKDEISFSREMISWSDIKKMLNEDDVTVEFFTIPVYKEKSIVDWQYCAALIKKEFEKPKVKKLCLRSDFLKCLSKNNLYSSSELYQLLWSPLTKEFGGVTNIYFSPELDLNKVPIEYLLNENGQRLNSLFNLYRLSSTSKILDSYDNISQRTAVLFGGIDYNKHSDNYISDNVHPKRDGVMYFPDIPGSKSEIQEISNLLNAEHYNVNMYTGCDASEKKLKSLDSKFRVLHFATHGFSLDPEKDDFYKPYLDKYSINGKVSFMSCSGLALSGVNEYFRKGECFDGEDGIMTSLEISQMQFDNLDLVVLSACETGLGTLLEDGIYGLQRGFKLAGANSILMSLWDVDDDATKILMVEFYKAYLNGESKLKSLQKAQEAVKSHTHRFEDPEYWAGFVLLDAVN